MIPLGLLDGREAAAQAIERLGRALESKRLTPKDHVAFAPVYDLMVIARDGINSAIQDLSGPAPKTLDFFRTDTGYCIDGTHYPHSRSLAGANVAWAVIDARLHGKPSPRYPNAQSAYKRVRRFCFWCDEHGYHALADVLRRIHESNGHLVYEPAPHTPTVRTRDVPDASPHPPPPRSPATVSSLAA